MKLNKPFDIPDSSNSNSNSSQVLDNYVFTNNKGLALFIIATIVILFVFWEQIIIKYMLFDLIGKYLPKIKVHRLIHKYKSW